MDNISGFISTVSPNQVVDRENYIKRILPIINDGSTSNIVILMSESAIGKSSLVDKLLDSKVLLQDKIRVRTLPINQSEKNEEWEFLKSIFLATYYKYQNTIDSFQEYIYSLKNESANKDMLYYVLTTIYAEDNCFSKMKISKSFFWLSILWLFKIGSFNIDNLIEDNSIRGNRIKAQYIKYILENHKTILAIDNIQNIDNNSLRELINIINETQHNTPQFLFEYTLTNIHSKNDCHLLSENISGTSVKTQVILLEKIESEYIVDVISKHMLEPNNNWEFNIKLQEEYQKNATGNIREMIDFGICYNETNRNLTEIEEHSLENILNLPDCSKQLLSIIICANNSITKVFLDEIAIKIGLDVESSIPPLLERVLIHETDDILELTHASLSDVWNSNSNFFNAFDNISYNCLEELYLKNIKKLENKGSQLYDQNWIDLIRIYSKYKEERLVSLFKYIDIDYKRIISRENAWKYIHKILNVIQGDVSKYYDLLIDIIRYCFESELYEEGFQVVQNIEKLIDTDIIILYHAMFLSALDKHEDNIEFCQIVLNTHEMNDFLMYNLKLISLSSYRSLNLLDECYSIHKELSYDNFFKDRLEYAYFLRLCEMYLDRNKSLKHLKKSVKLFENKKNFVQAGKSLISYSYVLASQGKLKQAKRQIEKAEKYLIDKRMGFHMFLVNKAAIRLYSGDYSDEVWEILNNSEITAVVPFDKLAIIVNKLVWCIENPKTNRHTLLINQALELLKKEPDRHIHGLIYYNIYYLLKSRDDVDYKIFLSKAEEMAPYCKPVYARLKNKPTQETKFALKYNWHVCFLAYWTYDLI